METFFRTFVFPEFESEHGFLRCRVRAFPPALDGMQEG